MKLHEIAGEDDDFPMANLKVLSQHVHHGRVFVTDRDADAAHEAAYGAEEGEGDVSIWAHWDSDTVYEISVASTTKAGVQRIMSAIKRAVPRAHLSMAHKSGIINHEDWRDFA